MGEAAARRTYRPGDWYAVLGGRVMVLLPPSEKARVAALWELVDDGAGFDEVFDALLASGLRRLPGFALVSERDDETLVVVRGGARARLTTAGESVDLEGSAATTWVERTFPDVTSLSLTVDEPGGDEVLTVAEGLVRVSVVEVGAVEVAADAGPVSTAESLPVEPDEPDEPGDAGDPGDADEPDAPPEAIPPTDHDGMTREGMAAVAGPSTTSTAASRPVARLVLSSGETVEVDRTVVVGRAPEARRLPAAEQPRLVSVPSPRKEISSTHLEFRPGAGADHDSAVVTDLGSTNGTVLVQPGLPPEDLRPGIAVQVLPGAVIDLGDDVTIQVLRP